MTPEEALVDVTARLTRLGVPHALVGGLAISIRAEVRFTRDVDLAIAVEPPGVAVAMAEHLLAMKVLSMRDARLQDCIDARGLLATGPVDVAEVRRLRRSSRLVDMVGDRTSARSSTP